VAITVTHPFVSAISDDPAAVAAGQVVPSNWNATHSLSGTLDVANGGTGTTTSTGSGSVVLSTGPTLAPNVVISGSSSGNALLINQTGSGNALVVEDDTNPDATPLVVDSTGVFIQGTTTAQTTKNITTTVTPPFQTHNLSSGFFSWSNNATFPAIVTFNKSKSGTIGTLGAVTSGDNLGLIQFNGADNDGTTPTFNQGAFISAQVAGAIATTSIPSRLNFATTAVAATSSTIRVSIGSEGYVGIGASASSAAQLLDLRGSNQGLTGDAPVNILRFTDTDTTSAANQPIGKIEFYNSDTANAAVGAYILSSSTGTEGGGTIRFGAAPNAGAVTEIARVASTGVTISNSVSIGTTGTVTGSVALNGSTSGTVTVNPAAAAGTWTLTLPTSAGTNGYVLSTDGAGVTSWIAQSGGGGGVSSFSAGTTGLTPNTATTGAVTLAGTLAVANGGTGVTTSTGTGNNVLSDSPTLGNIGVGGGSSGDSRVNIGGTLTGLTSYNGVYAGPTIGSSATGGYTGFMSRPVLQNAVFTAANIVHFYAIPQAKPASPTITAQYGFIADTGLTDASTVNYAFYTGLAASGNTRYAFYSAGSAPNYFSGVVRVGSSSTAGDQALNVGGAIRVSGTVSSLQTSVLVLDYQGAGGRVIAYGSSGSNHGKIEFRTATGGGSPTYRAALVGSANGANFILGPEVSPSGAVVFSIGNGTAPTASTIDTVQYYSSDLSAGNTMPSWWTEGTNVGTGTPTANRTIAVRFNGTIYYLLASTIP